MRSHGAGVILCVLASIFSARATYYLDDRDGSITYNSTAGVGYGKNWRKLSYDNDNLLAVSVNETQCFHGTASYTQCYPEDNCTISIPFNGTGITLFVPIDDGDIYNTTISLDGGAPIKNSIYNQAKETVYNFTLYDVQNLTWTTHTLTVGLGHGSSGRLVFDFAAVTGDAPPAGKSAAIRTLPGVMALLSTAAIAFICTC